MYTSLDLFEYSFHKEIIIHLRNEKSLTNILKTVNSYLQFIVFIVFIYKYIFFINNKKSYVLIKFKNSCT